jgi:hypothetical protein
MNYSGTEPCRHRYGTSVGLSFTFSFIYILVHCLKLVYNTILNAYKHYYNIYSIILPTYTADRAVKVTCYNFCMITGSDLNYHETF